MRKNIENFEITGSLEIEGYKTFDKIICIYSDDCYSNHPNDCMFKFDYISAELHNTLNPPYPNFKFIGNDYKIITGKCNGFSTHTNYEERKNYVLGQIDEIYSEVVYSEKKPNEYLAVFNVPYISLLSREVEYNFVKDENWIIKYTSPPISFKVANKEIKIDESIKLIKYEKPDSIFNRQVKIYIKSKIDKYEINEIRRNLLEFMDIFVASVSLILFHRINWFQYYIYVNDENDKGVGVFYQKLYHRSTGEDYLKEISDKKILNKYLTKDNLRLIISNMLEFNKNKRKELLRIFYSYITINEITRFEPKFLEAYFTLVAISKHIVKPDQNTNEVQLIKDAIDITKIKLSEIDFATSMSKRKKDDVKAEWLIYEYRNNLVHFNNFEFNNDEIYKEYEKIVKLIRRLIFFSIDSSLRDFTVP